MKKRFLGASGAIVLGLVLTACDGGSYDVHSTGFIDVPATGMHLYADQTVDSCGISSFDSWTAESSDPTWLSATPTSVNVPSGYQSIDWFYVHAEPNTSGAYRKGAITVKTYYTLTLPVQQEAYLNITRPTGSFAESSSLPTYTLALGPSASRDSVTFTVYTDGARFTADAPWLASVDTTLSKGNHTLYLNFSPNRDTATRTATATLTSAGVSANIGLTQDVKKEN